MSGSRRKDEHNHDHDLEHEHGNVDCVGNDHSPEGNTALEAKESLEIRRSNAVKPMDANDIPEVLEAIVSDELEDDCDEVYYMYAGTIGPDGIRYNFTPEGQAGLAESYHTMLRYHMRKATLALGDLDFVWEAIRSVTGYVNEQGVDSILYEGLLALERAKKQLHDQLDVRGVVVPDLLPTPEPQPTPEPHSDEEKEQQTLVLRADWFQALFHVTRLTGVLSEGESGPDDNDSGDDGWTRWIRTAETDALLNLLGRIEAAWEILADAEYVVQRYCYRGSVTSGPGRREAA